MSQSWSAGTDSAVRVMADGDVARLELVRAARAFDRVLRIHDVDGTARVRLTGPRCSGGPIVVQANVHGVGSRVRIQYAGAGGFAVAAAAQRLDRHLTRLASGQPVRSWPDTVRSQLAYVSDPRRVVRRKRFDVLRGGVRAAAAMLEAMDYDAVLFTEAKSDVDAIVYRSKQGIRLVPQRPPCGPRADSITGVHDQRDGVCCTESRAAALLCRTGLAFLFYTDRDCGRGRLLYRRFDGDLAVVVPS